MLFCKTAYGTKGLEADYRFISRLSCHRNYVSFRWEA